jgi:hypothetical protein
MKVISITSDEHWADYAEPNEHVVYGEELPAEYQMKINRAFAVCVIACAVFWATVGYRVAMIIHRVAR